MTSEKMEDIFAEYCNGNLSDFKKQVKKMKKLDMLDFIEYVQGHGGMSRHQIINILRNYLQ
jgi:flavorubredoxin